MHETRTGRVLSPPMIDSVGPRFVPDGLAGASLRLTTIAPDSNDFPSDFEISIEAFSNDRITVTGFFLGSWVYAVQKVLHKGKVVFELGLLLLLLLANIGQKKASREAPHRGKQGLPHSEGPTTLSRSTNKISPILIFLIGIDTIARAIVLLNRC